MSAKPFHWLFSLAILFCPLILLAQQKVTDSLKTVLANFATNENFESDTNYLYTLNALASRLNNIKPDTTIFLSDQIIVLCNKINYQKGKVDALATKGLAYSVKGEYDSALATQAEGLKLTLNLGYLRGAARLYQSTGIVYRHLGNYPEALENYFQSLKIREELADSIGISSTINGIGTIYFVQEKYTDALHNYLKSLDLSLRINYITGIETAYSNIGEVYYRQGKYDEAQENLLKASEFNRITGNLQTRSFLSTLIASIYFRQGRYELATKTYESSKLLAEEIGSQEYISRSLLGLADVNLAMENYDQALKYTRLGISIALQIGYIELLRDGNEIMSKILGAKGLGLQALYHHQQFKLYADSINNQQTELRAANLASDYEYSKKELLLIAEQERKEIEFQKKTNQQRWIIFSAFAALFSALVMIFLIYRSRQKEKKSNLLLHRKNTEIDKQKSIVEKAFVELETTQAQLIQSEKMASLGELTAGIAHEIQNPLNFVNNFSEVNKELADELAQEIEKGNYNEAKTLAKDIKENQEKINHHGKRADAIVKGMLQHSRTSSGQKELTDINALCDEYLRLAYHGLRAKDKTFNAKFETDLDKSLEKINVVPQDIGRVILNLITNAFYVVILRHPKGDNSYQPSVWVSTKRFGDRIEISIRDNGNGIPQKVLDKIFQPFFTTKPTGQGTGLGLSLSYDIVKTHGGEIKVNTKENEGSEFIIVLPF